ncbi:Histidine kinase 3 [Cytospora mali]|uniref:Histidine kinase 3 n=1 Tax=Cytospora mali TaxID=578113 RepID=A0A194V5F9_CYTMA|nr:Histidine kinase 3 [Valsa mali var. pyri (nom. inval.)]
MRPEAARERDLHRYYQPWKTAQNNLTGVRPTDHSNAWSLTYEGYKPRASGDKALTAFAQLATLRLNCRRAMVSLIDSHQQFIIAEATKTLSLVSDERHKPGDEVWLGNTIVKREAAVCYHTFKSTYTAKDENGEAYTTEALVVPDMRLDERFKDRTYVRGSPGVIFYAGVPIKTKAGHKIGVYAISDEKPRSGLTVDELVFMEDVAETVMEHLELAKDRDARMNGERMVRGLADFIEGGEGEEEPVVGLGANTVLINDTSVEDHKASPKMSAVMRQQTENAKRMLDDLDEVTGPPLPEGTKKESNSSKAKPTTARGSDDDSEKLLTRAARIIRISTEADGVVFFNTASPSLQGLGRQKMPVENTDLSSGMTSGDDKPGDSAFLTDSGEELRALNGGTSTRRALCEVMGLSVAQQEQFGKLQPKDFIMTADSMEKYIKRFPQGKFFSFTDTGIGVSSGDELSSEDKAEESKAHPHGKPATARPEAKAGPRRERLVPTELLKTLPGIRSLIFLPLWDFADAKYFAGCFIWTSTAGRLLNPENELPYLKAFGNCIMSEISRVKAERSDVAKSTFIASISHELRSPLHGILGSVEFLHETAVSAYQEGLFTSIETCGKTLLDTIDHVLDYAKINKLRRSSGGKRRAYARHGHNRDKGGSIVGLTSEFDLAILVEEVVDAVTAGHAFRRVHQGTSLDDGSTGGIASGAPLEVTSPTKSVLDPVVILKITPRRNWFVRTQPGAVRRIVMNLLGNALKYTDTGFVAVSLTMEPDDQNNLRARLRFTDSGRGMSLEFQRTRLFSPFSQEDPFATGTGLGLSIVRKIVEALDGDITINSTQHMGTEVNVVLTLPMVDEKPEQHHIDPETCSTKGTKMCIVNPSNLTPEIGVSTSDALQKGFCYLQDTLQDEFKEWFGMEVMEWPEPATLANLGQTEAHAPDFILYPLALTSTDALLKWLPREAPSKGPVPVIVMCSNAGQASDFRTNVAGRLLEKGIQAIPITQPLGPRKLANVFQKLGSGPQARPSNGMVDLTRQRIVLGRKESDPESMRRERDKLNNPSIVDVKPAFRPHILLVDDNEINLKLLVMFIKKQNMSYVTANNGLVALETYKSSYQAAASAEHAPPPFTHVLMDLSMPVMDGLTSTRKIRAFEAAQNIWPPSVIIALTGLASAEAQEDALSAGINNFLVKPVKFGELQKLLKEPGGS